MWEWIERPHSCFCQIHVVCIVIKQCKNSHVPFAFSFCQPSGNNFWVVSKNFNLNIYEWYKLSQMPSGPVQFAYNVLCECKPLQLNFSANLRCYSYSSKLMSHIYSEMHFVNTRIFSHYIWNDCRKLTSPCFYMYVTGTVRLL